MPITRRRRANPPDQPENNNHLADQTENAAEGLAAESAPAAPPDGNETVRVLFQAGKGQDGYFTNGEILKQVQAALAILAKHYPCEDHVFIFDNTTTHQKWADGALSAHNMPKFPSKNFYAYHNKVSDNGCPVFSTDGWIVKEPIQMTGAKICNGSPQDLYFPMDHPSNPRAFKWMMNILMEHRYTDSSQLHVQCDGLKYTAGATSCCCQRILPNFVAVKLFLETLCHSHSIQVLFLPKFHCELNPIEQCWGYAKRKYREYPRSSKESDLEWNVISALDSVPLRSIQQCIVAIHRSLIACVGTYRRFTLRFANRSLRFRDAYFCGLNGKQAAWAMGKYHGHCMLPSIILEEHDLTEN